MGQAMLVAYPREEDGSWKKLFAAIEKEQGLRLALFGESPRLRAFLRSEAVAFHDEGAEAPSNFEKDQLYLAEMTPEEASKLVNDVPAGHMILFVNEQSVQAGVYTITSLRGVVTKVTLPLLNDLATNPQTRKTFADIIQQHLNNHPQSP